MADRREEVLDRLVAICEGIPGIITVARNVMSVNSTEYPALIVQDADEDAEPTADRRGRGAQMVTMTPVVAVMLSDTAPAIGTLMNTFRAALIKAVLEDSALQGITGPNGAVRYEGMQSGLQRARKMEGSAGIGFAFTYPLKISEL